MSAVACDFVYDHGEPCGWAEGQAEEGFYSKPSMGPLGQAYCPSCGKILPGFRHLLDPSHEFYEPLARASVSGEGGKGQ